MNRVGVHIPGGSSEYAYSNIVSSFPEIALESYSPEYNPIERFWKWLKATVYGATAFETIAEVSHKVRQIIWHYNEHWLKSTIHFGDCLSEPNWRFTLCTARSMPSNNAKCLLSCCFVVAEHL